MTRDEIVTALRCCADIDGEFECSTTCPFFKTSDELGDCCTKKNVAAADLIENQQRHIEALMKANDSLKDAIARRDKQIEDKYYVCNDCGAVFSVPDKHTYRENLDGENGFMTVEEFCCPFCGSDEIEEAD